MARIYNKERLKFIGYEKVKPKDPSSESKLNFQTESGDTIFFPLGRNPYLMSLLPGTNYTIEFYGVGNLLYINKVWNTKCKMFKKLRNHDWKYLAGKYKDKQVSELGIIEQRSYLRWLANDTDNDETKETCIQILHKYAKNQCV